MPRWLRVVLLVLIAAGVVVLLFTVVFPWVEQQTQDPTIAGAVLLAPLRPGQWSRAPR